MNAVQSTLAAALLAGGALLASPAGAAPIVNVVNADFSSSPYTITMGGDTFDFSYSGDIFGPLSIQTGGAGEVSSFGGFLGIPVEPTTYFVDRGDGVVQFGPGVFGSYASFSSPTEIMYSNAQNFIGLEAVEGANTYYGYAYTDNTTLVSYGFESTPNTTITAEVPSVSAAPEPAAWLLMIAGLGATGAMLRARRRDHGAAVEAA